MNELLFHFKGTNGEIKVYTDKINIEKKGISKGNTSIPILSISNIVIHKGSLTSAPYVYIGSNGTEAPIPGTKKVVYNPNTIVINSMSASSNKAKFNEAEKMKNVIEDLIQKTNNKSTNANNTSVADELLKFKQLLDNNAITQEEYDKKKMELLNSSNQIEENIKSNVKEEKVKEPVNENIEKKKSNTKWIFIIILAILFINSMFRILNTSNSKSTYIWLKDNIAGEYGTYNETNECFEYRIPEGTYKIVEFKDNNTNRLFNLLYWQILKNDSEEYAKEGTKYRKSFEDKTEYISECSDTFTINEGDYIILPTSYDVKLELLK